jgi:hypothetical protein
MINRLIIFILTIILIPDFLPVLQASDYNLQDPQAYILRKLKQNDISFLGTRHKQASILTFIQDLIPKLSKAGVTHIGLEIESDQQAQIDHYIKTGEGLSDIKIHPQIDCQDYRYILKVLRDTIINKRPITVALDLPTPKYEDHISRDEWMAKSITKVFESDPNAKMLVVVGNLHVLKKLDWQDHVPNKHRSIREYLLDSSPNLKMSSIGQVIGKSVFEDDFRDRFSVQEGAVALDLDERFDGWKSGIVQSIAIKHTEVFELLDGLVVY